MGVSPENPIFREAPLSRSKHCTMFKASVSCLERFPRDWNEKAVLKTL
jgi:hypothetical protein